VVARQREGGTSRQGGRERRARRLSRKFSASAVRRPEERVIPFNRGIEFFPDAERAPGTGCARLRRFPCPPPPPSLPPSPATSNVLLPFSRPSLCVLSSAAQPTPEFPLSLLPPLPHSPPPSPGIPGTAVSQPWRRVARGNCASRRRRADVTPAMELTRAAPLYAVVEGNKKCKSKRVGVGEWEKKNKRRARVERGERARAGKERNIETERERERERESENRARSNAAGKGTQRAERERERERGWKFRVSSCTCPGLCAMFNPRG